MIKKTKKESIKNNISNNKKDLEEDFSNYNLSINNDVKKLREQTGMNRKEFCNYFQIPYRTVEDWENRKSNCSNYLFNLMKENLELKGLI